ncbi:helix-turn-helix domain-containing protein [Paenibacillus solisilvae]|uniref:Helix-turn-helix domain-containing protein n=1 Tax=Paenibacillus solisilvae TaxID=2486751 RepID=A0ABW0VYT3_9BACL
MQQKSWNDYPILPYVRLCYRFISSNFFQAERRLLDYLILFLEKGTYELTVEGTAYMLYEGDFALIQPGIPFTTKGIGECVVPNAHLDWFYNAERSKSFVTTPGQTHIDGYMNLLQPQLNDFPSIRLPVKLYPEQPLKCRDTLYRMIEHFKHNDIRSMLTVQKLATELLLLLLGSDGNTSAGSNEFEEQQFVNKMNAFLSFHLSTPLTVDKMAKHAGYSDSHFSTVFIANFGSTPHQYLVKLRIQKARELLSTTSLNLELIAEYCGFGSASHLSKAYKSQTGLSPREYRRSLS